MFCASLEEHDAAYDYARRMIGAICCLAGSAALIEGALDNDAALQQTIRRREPCELFRRLLHAFNFQGIADEIASEYIERHGLATWKQIQTGLEHASCAKLKNYWTFSDCGYRKLAGTCNAPDQFSSCPLPQHELRNGRLNQIAYALFLFIRDIADGDLVTWINNQLTEASQLDGPGRISRMIESLVGPLRNIHGISDKVVMMSCRPATAARSRLEASRSSCRTASCAFHGRRWRPAPNLAAEARDR